MQGWDQKFKSLFWCWTFYRKHIFSKSAFLRIRWYFNKVLYVRKEVTAFIICQSSFKLQTYPDRTNFTWFISDIRYLQSSDLFSRSNALCKLCLRVAISFCSVNKHLTCPILPIFLRYFISSMASPSIKLNWKCPYFEQIAPNSQVTWSLSQCPISNQQNYVANLFVVSAHDIFSQFCNSLTWIIGCVSFIRHSSVLDSKDC